MTQCNCQAESFSISDSPARRQWLIATAGVGGALAMTALIPFVSSLLPSERAKAAGAPVEVDIDKLAQGEMMIVEWRGKPVWILHRTPEMLAAMKKAEPNLADPGSSEPQQPAYATNEFLHPPWLLALRGIRGRRGINGRRLARRLSLPLPRFNLRFRRSGIQKQTGPDQPGNPAPHLSDRCAIDYWQRRKGCRLKSGPGSKLKTIERKICANGHHSSKSKSARSLPD